MPGEDTSGDDHADYRVVNRASWDERAPAHAASAGYALDRFRTEPDFLSHVVRFDQPRLGDVRGLTGVHLQCHIGTDTVSLARLGARMTGLDFSPAALVEARALAAATGADVTFVESDVYDAAAALDGRRFDLVYTGVGALGWLPSIGRWAATVASLLRPGGRLFIREGHPALLSLDDAPPDGPLTVVYPYFERPEPMVFNEPGTYVATDAVFTHNLTHEWNHGIGELLTAVIAEGMVITGYVEHETVPWEALPGRMVLLDNGEWRLREQPWRVPMSYTLQARRPA